MCMVSTVCIDICTALHVVADAATGLECGSAGERPLSGSHLVNYMATTPEDTAVPAPWPHLLEEGSCEGLGHASIPQCLQRAVQHTRHFTPGAVGVEAPGGRVCMQCNMSYEMQFDLQYRPNGAPRSAKPQQELYVVSQPSHAQRKCTNGHMWCGTDWKDHNQL